jgi:hypothetical protein
MANPRFSLMRCVLPACNHFYYFLALPSLFALSSRGWKYAPLLVTVSFRHLRSAVDASNYDVEGRNGSPGMMAFVSGTAGQIGKPRLVGGPIWPCLIQAPDPLVLAACPAGRAHRPGARGLDGGRNELHDLRAGAPAELSTSEVICTDVRSSVNGLWATCLHGPSCMIAAARWQ